MLNSCNPFGIRALLLAGGAVSALSIGAGSALAQEGEAAEGSKVEKVVVTGSRIARRDHSANSPLQTVDAEAFKQTGAVTVEHLLNTMPQVVPGISSQSNNPSSNGRAFIDLRGLGSGRNLVLIDGRRPMGSTSGGTVDVNTIPAALVDRVEIITGGASAVYGPDAISGVVNFIMKRDFEGVAVNGTYGISEQGDAKEISADGTVGSTFADGKGHAVFSFSFATRDALGKGDRGFSAQANGATGSFPGGSWNPGTATPSAAAVSAMFGAGLCATNGGTRGFGFNDDGSLFCTGVVGNPALNVVNYNSNPAYIATQFFPDSFSYNFEPDNKLVLPLERTNFYTAVSLEITPWFKPYATGIFTNYNAEQELAPTPASGFSVPVTNPFIPPALATLLASRTNPAANFSISKRFNAVGGRSGYNDHDNWQTVMGSEGDLWGTWSYDAYFSYGRSVMNEIQRGNIRVAQVNNLLTAADGGASLCAGGFNPFGDQPMSQACQDYISLTAKNLTTINQLIGEATLTGELINLPAGPVETAIGASYRELDFDFLPDSGLQPGAVVGFNGQLPIRGYLDYRDLFAEVSVPLLSDIELIQSLTVVGGYRITENNKAGQADTWKVDGNWVVDDTLRFRGGVQHAVRSPTVAELFAPQVPNFPNINNQDPCNVVVGVRLGVSQGWGTPAQVEGLCTAQAPVAGGAAFFQPFAQAQAITGGNPDLVPEVADTWTVGGIVTSQSEDPWIQRASFSVDYWNIEIEKYIAAVGASTIIQRCFNRDGANPTFNPANSYCSLYVRDQTDGRIINLLQLSQNQAFLHTSGVDVTFNWGFDLDLIPELTEVFGGSPGTLDFSLAATWWEQYKFQTTAEDPLNDFAGTIGAGTASATPEYKATLTTTYTRDELQLALRTRYIDAMNHSNTVTGGGASSNVPATWYLDLSGRYDLTEWLSMRATVNNLLDQEPRLYSPNVQANTDPSTYDVVGRRFLLGVDFRM